MGKIFDRNAFWMGKIILAFVGKLMEAYVNFGWIGVIFSAILQGYISAYIENLFYEMCKEKVGLHLGKVLMIVLLQKLQGFLICTSGNYTYLYLLRLFYKRIVVCIDKDKKKYALYIIQGDLV